MNSFVLFVYGLSCGYGLLRPTATATAKSPAIQLIGLATEAFVATGRAETVNELNRLGNDSVLQANMLTHRHEIQKRGDIQKDDKISELKNFSNEINEGEFKWEALSVVCMHIFIYICALQWIGYT